MKRNLDILVISDLHLGTYGSKATEVLTYLKTVDAKKIVINGDFVDIMIFNKRFWPNSHMNVVKYFLDLISQGKEIYYVVGNHDESLRKFLNFKIPLKTAFLIIVLPIFFVFTGITIFSLLDGEIGQMEFIGIYTIPAILFAGIYAGPLGEELGWRGLLLPELQNIFSPLKSSLIIGVVWFCWHIPLFWAPVGTLISGNLSFVSVLTYFAIINCLSIIITWLYNQSSNNLWTAILFHLFINAGIALVLFPELTQSANKIHLYSSAGMLIFTFYLLTSRQLLPKKNTRSEYREGVRSPH